MEYIRKQLQHLNIKTGAYCLLTAGALLSMWFLGFGGYICGSPFSPDVAKAKDIQPFITGLVLPLFTLGSALLVVENLRATTIQNFSSNFFKLIDFHHKLTDNISSIVDGISLVDRTTGKIESSRGRDFFDDLAYRIAVDYNYVNMQKTLEAKYSPPVRINLTRPIPHLSWVKPIYGIKGNHDHLEFNTTKDKLLVDIYDYYFHIHHSDLSHYFRNLYYLVEFVERAPISEKLKINYMNILRAQLTNYEMLLLAYNGLHKYGKEFFPYIEKYKMIVSLNNELRLAKRRKKRIIDIAILKAAYKQLSHWPDVKC